MAGDNVEVLCHKARQAVAEGKTEQARQIYLQALGLKSDSPDVHYGLATVCFMLNDLPSAAHHFKEVTRLDPLRAGAYINLGAVYNRMEQLDDAIQALRRGIGLDTHRGEGYYNLGLVYRRKGQNDLAVQAYKEAVRVNPRMPDAHLNLANIYVEKEQYRLAITHYRHALEIRPQWEKALSGLRQAEAAQMSVGQPTMALVSKVEEKPASKGISIPGLDANRVLDPNSQGMLLTTLHKATIESENFSRGFLQILESQIEPALKELSTCLLYPDSSAGELDQCVVKFETAVQGMRSAQRTLQSSIERVRSLGEKLMKS